MTRAQAAACHRRRKNLFSHGGSLRIRADKAGIRETGRFGVPAAAVCSVGVLLAAVFPFGALAAAALFPFGALAAAAVCSAEVFPVGVLPVAFPFGAHAYCVPPFVLCQSKMNNTGRRIILFRLIIIQNRKIVKYGQRTFNY